MLLTNVSVYHFTGFTSLGDNASKEDNESDDEQEESGSSEGQNTNLIVAQLPLLLLLLLLCCSCVTVAAVVRVKAICFWHFQVLLVNLVFFFSSFFLP